MFFYNYFLFAVLIVLFIVDIYTTETGVRMGISEKNPTMKKIAGKIYTHIFLKLGAIIVLFLLFSWIDSQFYWGISTILLLGGIIYFGKVQKTNFEAIDKKRKQIKQFF